MKIFLIIATTFLLGSCTVNYTAEYDKETDFSGYNTYCYYGWADGSDLILNQFDKERIESEFAKRFSQRGINYIKENGDLVISLFVVVDQKTSITAYNNYYGGGGWGGYYGGGWGMGYSTTNYHEYDYLVGTIVIDVFDSENKQLIWQGVISQVLDDNPDSRERELKRNIAMLMNKFPKDKIKKSGK